MQEVLPDSRAKSSDQSLVLQARAKQVRSTTTQLAQTAALPLPAEHAKRKTPPVFVLEESPDTRWNFQRPAALAWSVMLHVAVIGALASILMPPKPTIPPVQPFVIAEALQNFEEPKPTLEVETPIVTLVAPAGLPFVMSSLEEAAKIPDAPNVAAPLPGDPAPPPIAPASLLAEISTISPLSPVRSKNTAGGGFPGRHQEARALLVDQRGGSKKSVVAVEQASDWILEHQLPDGSWRFDHNLCGCKSCQNPGYATSATAATGLALLPLLANRQTHRHGEHQLEVSAGLNFLIVSGKKTSRGNDLQDGTMYGQAIAAIALCEAYELTDDPVLLAPAQGAINFIVAAQHHEGGWRYYPDQAGDTTVLGWQMMALQTAIVAGLEVPEATLIKAAEFLQRVEDREGGGYGYQEPGASPAPTASGILSSMYLGRHPDEPGLRLGIDRLVEWGPSQTDMYYNYYATQVLHHDNTDHFKRWNAELRDHLVDSQSLDGHAKGSWFFADKHAYAGGRLYTTAMCSLILEIYYRHEPMYEPDRGP